LVITSVFPNARYFKRWHIPGLRRAGAKLDAKALEWEHGNATLLITVWNLSPRL
jgi:hypothetical protein